MQINDEILGMSISAQDKSSYCKDCLSLTIDDIRWSFYLNRVFYLNKDRITVNKKSCYMIYCSKCGKKLDKKIKYSDVF